MNTEITPLEQTIPTTTPIIPNQQLTEEYLSTLISCSPVTIYNWTIFFRTLLNDIKEPFQKLTTIDLRNYIIGKKEAGKWNAVATLALNIRFLKAFFKFLVSEHYINELYNPARNLKYPRNANETAYRTITLKEIRILLKTAEGPMVTLKDRLIFYIAMTSGLRAKEIASIKKEHIDLEKRLIFIPKDDVKGKYREKRVPVSTRTKELIETYLVKCPSPINNIFVNHWGKPMHRNQVYASMKKIIDIAFPYKNSWDKSYGAHLARHTFATRWIESGGDLQALRAIMGWKSLAQLDRYISVSPNFISKAAMKVEKRLLKG